MNILLKSACIIDDQSKFNKQAVDILIENGIITTIDNTIKASNNIPVLNLENLHVSQGWFDSSVSLGEPGFEERETLANGLKTAALSGFSGIALHPNTLPIIDNASAVAFLKSKTTETATSIFPIGALTEKSIGIDLAELYDMHTHGACSFGDYKKPINNSNLLKLALQYSQNFDGLVQSYPQDSNIASQGIVNEHITSTQLGLKGIPNLAEELQIVRDLFILEYTGGKLHIPTISTSKSVALIKEAKEKGLNVSCSVTVYNLIINDKELTEFNSHYKLRPPLRTKNDCDALIEGVLNGTIDMITSDHCPMNIENKQVEFDNASYGSIGLESTFGSLINILPLEVIIQKLTAGRNRFCNKNYSIETGSVANLSLFNPKGTYLFSKNNILSSSKNAAFLGYSLTGKTYGVIANNKLELNNI